MSSSSKVADRRHTITVLDNRQEEDTAKLRTYTSIYSTSTHKFTAPIAGMYFFSWLGGSLWHTINFCVVVFLLVLVLVVRFGVLWNTNF